MIVSEHERSLFRQRWLSTGFPIALLGFLLFIPLRGHVRLFDWDEINFAEVSREMLVSGDFLNPTVNFEPFYEKPPLFFWVQALCMRVMGVSEASARLPNALLGIGIPLVLLIVGSRIVRMQVGVLWALLMMTSFLPFFYFRSGIMDVLLNFLVFLSLWDIYRTIQDQKPVRALRSGIWAGLAFLTKGPVGPLVVLGTWGLTWFFYRTDDGRRLPFPWKAGVLWLAGVLVGGGWYYLVDLLWNDGRFMRHFLLEYHVRLITTPDAGHRGFLLFHPVVLLLGVFPASVIAIEGFRHIRSYGSVRLWNTLMVVWLVLVVVGFSLVRTKIIHYSSMAYYPITWFAAYALGLREAERRSLPSWMEVGILALATLYGVAMVLAPIVMNMREEWMGMIGDAFVRDALQVPVEYPVSLVFLGLMYLVGYFIIHFSYRTRPFFWGIYLSLVNGVVAFFLLYAYAPRVERHTRGTIIQVYESMNPHTTEVIPLNFKTYAPTFYLGGTGVVPPSHREVHYVLRVYRRKQEPLPDSVLQTFRFAFGYYYRIDTVGFSQFPYGQGKVVQ